jgi:hypothetical protein
VLFGTSEATSVLPAAAPAPGWARPSDIAVAATVTEPIFATSAFRADWRLLRPGQLVLAGIATILIAGAYAAYRINAATPDAMAIASQPIDTHEHEAPTATSSVPMPVESKPVEPERTPALQVPGSRCQRRGTEPSKRASTLGACSRRGACKRASTPRA